MKKILFPLILLLSSAVSFAGENYEIEINGHTYGIELDKEKHLALPDGVKLRIKLSLKEYIDFESQLFSFSHKNIHKPSKSDLGNGVYQTLIATPRGTVLVIQEYTTMDPSGLVDGMLKEVTKEKIEYGYKYEEKEVVKTMGNIELKGKEAIATYKQHHWTYTVYSYGGKDVGIAVVTMILESNADKDKHLINDFWKTLRINF